MKTKVLAGLAILIILGAIGALVYASITLNNEKKEDESHLIELKFKDLEKKVANKESFILVFTQTTCGHCAEYKPIISSTLNDYDIYGYEIVLDKLSKDEKAKLVDIANVTQTPTTTFFKDGQEINSSLRLVGGQSKDKLVNRFKYLGYIK